MPKDVCRSFEEELIQYMTKTFIALLMHKKLLQYFFFYKTDVNWVKHRPILLTGTIWLSKAS